MKLFFAVWLVCLIGSSTAARLSVSGKNFLYNGKTVFLSGVNIAWNSYGYDFGNGQYANSKTALTNWLKEIATNGGNSVRIWVHVEGDNTPAYDTNGYVTGPDRTGTLVSDLRQFLDAAKTVNILVTFVLWNGAHLENQKTINLFWDKTKLQTYLDKALKPMVAGLAGHPALAAWEIINEPEGIVRNNNYNTNPCYNTQVLANSGAGWKGKNIPMQNILQFINWQADTIHANDAAALVTVGSWSELPQTDAFSNSRNYYTDACLVAAGGRALGKLNFYQMHTYSWNGAYSQTAPFKVKAATYALSKPLVIGEFSSRCSERNAAQQLYNYAYNNGYQGAWGWQFNAQGNCTDQRTALNSGLLQLKGKSTAAGLVTFSLL